MDTTPKKGAGVGGDSSAGLPAYQKQGAARTPRADAVDSRLSVLWRHRAVWFFPLVGEALLLLAAANLALALGKVMRGSAQGTEWIWLAGACAAFVATRLISSLCELFMPRFVALLGVGTMCVVSLGLIIGLLVPEPWHVALGELDFKHRLLAGLPLGLFLFRASTVIRASRYSPGLRDMSYYSRSMTQGMFERFKTRLEFWMR